MKRVLMFALVPVMALMVFSSCGSGNAGVTGTWELEDMGSVNTFIFESDGKGSSTYTIADTEYDSYDFTYAINGNVITFITVDEDGEEQSQERTFSVEKDRLTIISGDSGTSFVFTKKK